MRMILHKKQAFSLTELLIVLVVIAILFAAMAPIVTKRRNGADIANENVWNYVNDDDQMDAFYDPGMRTWTSTAVFGFTPSKLESPYAKTIIKAKPKQRMIQFRYGSGFGISTGSLFLDDKNNIYLTSNNDKLVNADKSKSTTAAGLGALSNRSNVTYSVALGSDAFKGDKDTSSTNDTIINAIGSASSKNLKGVSTTTAIGALSNQSRINPVYTVAIGGQSLASFDYHPQKSVYVGYSTGAGEKNTSDVAYNTILGSSYPGGEGSNSNTILGYNSYTNGYEAAKHVTAVGAYTCNSIKGVKSDSANAGRTCIGYGSGREYNNTPDAFTQDDYDRVFLGGTPLGGFNGRGVVEVHNINTSYTALMEDEAGNKESLPSNSVVMNSNIVVRGGLYTYSPRKLVGHRPIGINPAWTNNFQCHGDYYLSVSGKRGYHANNTPGSFGKPGDKSESFFEAGNTCGGLDKYPTGTSGCPNLKTTSDRRLKDNISENNSGLKEILTLKPYEYIFKSDKKKTPQVGVIAQDLQKVFPNSVHQSEDGYLHIRWDEMFYAMINAIKTLDKKVVQIASDITGMESDVKQLKSSHSKIQKQIASLNERATKLERK
ncbi:prepilin-type N-terminal cleavage/methylation domain-containing protein [bacterium]|nr:prepilin-type N-terminal cleavage/methylation domain-containing protein [bacterium]